MIDISKKFSCTRIYYVQINLINIQGYGILPVGTYNSNQLLYIVCLHVSCYYLDYLHNICLGEYKESHSISATLDVSYSAIIIIYQLTSLTDTASTLLVILL